MTEIRGGCHCAEVGVRFRTDTPPDQLRWRTCACAYCTRQGARYVSDPAGGVAFDLRDIAGLIRYKFATATAEFLSCAHCGVYLGAISRIHNSDYAVLNANVLELPPSSAPAARFDDEPAADRLERRARTWTPVTSAIGAEPSPPIRWSLHLSSPPARVHAVLDQLANCGTIESVPPVRYSVACPDGAAASFHIEGDGRGGSDLRLVATCVRKDRWLREYTAWVADLLTLKARVDFEVELRTDAPQRTLAHRYVDGVG